MVVVVVVVVEEEDELRRTDPATRPTHLNRLHHGPYADHTYLVALVNFTISPLTLPGHLVANITPMCRLPRLSRDSRNAGSLVLLPVPFLGWWSEAD